MWVAGALLRSEHGRVAVTVLLVEDHSVFTEALVHLLGREPDLQLLGAVRNPDEAMTLAEAEPPEVAVIDVALGQASGIELAARLRARHPDLCVVVISAAGDAATAAEAIRAGAIAFVPKDAPVASLVEAIRCAVRGEAWIPAPLLAPLLRRLAGSAGASDPVDDPATRVASLSSRELDVLRLLTRGLDRAGIAEQLGLSVNTVRSHLQHVFAKLGVGSSLEAVGVALRAGLRPDNGPRALSGR